MNPSGTRDANGRSLRSVVAVAALVLFVLGALLGRLTAPDAGAPDGSRPPADAPTGPVAAVGGVPVGYARTEAGAVAAAVAYTQVLDGIGGLGAASREAALELIASDDARGQLSTELAASAGVIAESLGLTAEAVDDEEFVARPIPAGYRIDSFTQDAASVSVWGTAVFIAPGRQASSDGWSTVTVELVWENADWRVSSRETADGPTPPDTPTPPKGIGTAINAFQEFAHAPLPQ